MHAHIFNNHRLIKFSVSFLKRCYIHENIFTGEKKCFSGIVKGSHLILLYIQHRRHNCKHNYEHLHLNLKILFYLIRKKTFFSNSCSPSPQHQLVWFGKCTLVLEPSPSVQSV